MIVGTETTRDGYTYADVTDDGKHVGRIVKSGPTWAPDSALLTIIGSQRWCCYDDAKAALEAA